MSESLVLDEWSHNVWQELAQRGLCDVNELAAALETDQSKILVVAQEGAAGGFIAITEVQADELMPTEESVALVNDGLAERKALALLVEAGGEIATGDFAKTAGAAGIAVNDVFRWGNTRGWIQRDKTGVRITDAGRAAANGAWDADEQAIITANGSPIDVDTLTDPDRVRQLLGKRNELAKIKTRTRRSIELTEQGTAALEAGISVKKERNLLTADDLKSGAWREITLRPYDVSLPAEDVHPAKPHPLRKIIDQTRRAYLEMGFTEVVSPMVESSFWNFDALFQPQDHPARDMQDTFYMGNPATADLPTDDDLVDRVRAAHEDGGDTGSEGWGYKWSPEVSKQVVLRTHTTASTIRAMAKNPNPPFKCFCVGWVCRNETMSYKHLPVFHQVDGIVIDENASLATLMGTLETFYKKMGFQKVKFKPAFYPYTEPSVDVVVYLESRGKW
ncbi:UNVERIFIED_CONTAM: hypothetical protein GTU68_016243, partial [Idotea baltica]|nr:hypothetical protein [Idotea baltica]